MRFSSLGAVDFERAQARTYAMNFPESDVRASDIEAVIPGNVGATLSDEEHLSLGRWRHTDFLVGGPPCQGHSNLNNVTRRTDERNLLVLKMARAAEISQPKFIVIENVPAISRDKHQAASRLIEQLQVVGDGYKTTLLKLKAEEFGVAQTRHRSFIIAWNKVLYPDLTEDIVHGAINAHKVGRLRPIEWAIGDLVASTDTTDIFNTAPQNISEETKARIAILYAQEDGQVNLPDEYRPPCHRDKDHTYGSVYGRMRAGQPAPTITTGFGTMGRGRFVHPSEQRVLTPHEAARVQFFPDFFKFGTTSRADLHRSIGNAVPPKLGFVVAVSLLQCTLA